jgi:uncharacterized membrane protein YhaH (DUF805 family)
MPDLGMTRTGPERAGDLLKTGLRFHFSADGRIGRIEFLVGVCVNASMLGSLALVLEAASVGRDPSTTLLVLLALVTHWSSLMLSIKRLHDLGKSGWVLLFVLVPVAGLLLPMLLLLLPGEEHNNTYGPINRLADQQSNILLR